MAIRIWFWFYSGNWFGRG